MLKRFTKQGRIELKKEKTQAAAERDKRIMLEYVRAYNRVAEILRLELTDPKEIGNRAVIIHQIETTANENRLGVVASNYPETAAYGLGASQALEDYRAGVYKVYDKEKVEATDFAELKESVVD